MDSITSNNSLATQNTQSQLSALSQPQQNSGEEFNTFIQLLTAQIRNQDPLEPLDSTQFVEQLATFSTLEQQVRSNDSLESIATMINDLHAIVASEWLGQAVSVESSWVPYTGEAVDFSFDAPPEVDRAVLTVSDSNGNITYSEQLDRSKDTHSWDGRTQAGDFVAVDSLNRFSIDLYRGNDFVGSVAPRVLTTVTDVASENGKLRLGTAMKMSADFADIRKLDE